MGLLKNVLKTEEEEFLMGDASLTLGDLFRLLGDRGGNWADQFENAKSLRAAINGKISKPSASIYPSNRVAIFLPIAGG
ncbi:MoaD/ThiS family protein [Glaciimonas immobilis]|uniref:Molybdopterin converting factor small subunit n=1 Tax=Glaciimonas immobilis TaxID=728004 RepID=A0A840RT44_9BURK|nr:MoaD/ThiS family protein [Glaciimonas immobilis]KAF3997026.1 MoaD/ThiS family protein [Glaciimonas immobilis]MBB5199864.1 molybdopterin converting factor small subunit [Glaciimonas immobilis]